MWAYYDDASSKRLIDQVAVPLLVLNAADDPIAHGEGIPTHIAKSNDKVFFGITKEGGHVAWCEGLWPAWGSWESRVVPEFFDAIQNSLEFLQEEQVRERGGLATTLCTHPCMLALPGALTSRPPSTHRNTPDRQRLRQCLHTRAWGWAPWVTLRAPTWCHLYHVHCRMMLTT